MKPYRIPLNLRPKANLTQTHSHTTRFILYLKAPQNCLIPSLIPNHFNNIARAEPNYFPRDCIVFLLFTRGGGGGSDGDDEKRDLIRRGKVFAFNSETE